MKKYNIMLSDREIDCLLRTLRFAASAAVDDDLISECENLIDRLKTIKTMQQ